MKNPLHYQFSEYDCGPTSMQNAISFLFEREEIPPEVLRNIMLYCLDCYSSEGVPGKSGTSCAAMMFLSNWLNSMGNLGILPVKSRYLSGKEVYLGNESYVNDALRRGGAVVLRLFSDEWHYVLLTGEEGEHVYMFDPYYDQEEYGLDDIQIVENCPTRYNRIVPWKYFNKIALNVYSLGPYQGREAIILFNKNTELTSEKTIEYFI